MVKSRLGVRLIAAGLLLCGMGIPAQAAPTVAQMLAPQFRPKQAGVDFSVPPEAEHNLCEVKLVTGTRAGSNGWLLLDVQKKPVLKFFDSDGDRRIDVWSYYKNGLEVYREIDSNRNNSPDQFRWLNSGGMKWGIDADEDGKIDSWKEISSEELAQEAFQAVVTRDFRRLQVLFISEAELQTLGLPQTYIERIRVKLQQASARFQETVAKMPELAHKDTVGRVESAPPQCVPGESIGIKQDLLRYPSRTVLFEVANKQHQWLQTNEMVLVGNAWRLLDVPVFGDIGGGEGGPNPEVQKLMEQLAALDSQPPTEMGPGPNAEVVDYSLKRAGIIKQLLSKVADTEKENWLRQLGDSLASAYTHARSGDSSSLEELRQLKDQVAQQSPNSNMAGYLTFRVLWAEYSTKLVTPSPDLPKIQAEWMEKLSGFVASYPKADDTPDALIQLAMGSEFTGKEEEAKRWYQQLASNFPQHHLADKAEGAVRRLNLVGNKMPITGKTVAGTPFDNASLHGKVVAVYYWASYCETCSQDFEKLAKIKQEYGAKGFEIVSINLDDQEQQALQMLQKLAAPGVHLREGGMNSPLATQYGIMGLPTLFLIGKDGNVISRTIQLRDLEDEVRKAL